MDPLSITASVIALIGALRAVTKGYKSITDLGKAPQEFRDLVGEIESVHAYLGMLHSVLDMGSSVQAFAALDLTPLGSALSRLDYTIQELQTALKQTETDSKTSEEGRKLSKIKWQVYKSKVAQLRDEVRSRKQDLVDKIGLLQLALGVLHTSLLPNAYVRAEVSYTRRDHSSSGQAKSTVLLNNKQNETLSPMAMGSQPWLLSTVRQLLSLFTTSMYWETSLCDDPACRDISQQKIALVYQIPLFHFAVSLRLTWDSVFGPGASLYLRVARIVTDTSAFATIQYGTVQRLRFLFDEGIALPNDIQQYGESLLLMAVIYNRTEMIDYLLAGFSYEDTYDLKPPENPLQEALRKGDSVELELILNEYPSLVNELAEYGPPPLHIATINGLHSAMELLLLRGADPWKRDAFGDTAIHRAITWNDYKATEILLRFPGNYNLLDRYDRSLLEIALLYSSSKIICLLLSSGIRAGVQLDPASNAFRILARRDPSKSQDENGLEAIVHHLLNAGYSFDDDDDCERWWNNAVARDNYHMLRILLKNGLKLSQRKGGDYNILHCAANHATLDTIEVLREANIREFDVDAEFSGWTAMGLFEYRGTCPDGELLAGQTRPTAEDTVAFMALINEVRERRERNNDENTLLGVNGPEGNNSKTDEQPSLPGAWVE
ncbi:hypothetical protein E0Z10_g6970 [Xylaria hypoxylon]|uniref:Azaphilone pigments biosynthesis cluster protein L N-terminal domain-containing protein n=1 Tax=Xylaria hypoxylon TaxID=37992 RepID=A0A4Z0YRY7_9PEZI|nr:hypothetical protein E0Z10_g6970 [Xylaria hypoxylon]